MSFNPDTAIAIVADDVSRIRRVDVFRLFDWCDPAERSTLANYVRSERPDLSAEIDSVLEELATTDVDPATPTTV